MSLQVQVPFSFVETQSSYVCRYTVLRHLLILAAFPGGRRVKTITARSAVSKRFNLDFCMFPKDMSMVAPNNSPLEGTELCLASSTLDERAIRLHFLFIL
jgi:hypothetical protein